MDNDKLNLDEILAFLDQMIGQPTPRKPGNVKLRVEGDPIPSGDVGDLVDFMNYDGDPNMGPLRGLFGGRAQPGTNHMSFYDQLGKRRRGK